jgi:hypothetical protein
MVNYTNNVPQATETIASTQPTILDNFNYIQEAIGEEHNMVANDTDPTHTFHLQASMPNQALSPVINAATDGVYFVSGGKAYFYDKTINWNLNQWEAVLTGSYTATSASSYNTIAAIPANKVGTILLYQVSSIGFMQSGQFCTTAGQCIGFSDRIKINGSSDDYIVELNNRSGTLNLQGRSGGSSYTGFTYTSKIFYRPV